MPEMLPSLGGMSAPRVARDSGPKVDEVYDRAQRQLSTIVHHTRWHALRSDLAADRREAVRFVSASQQFAGSAFNAVPSRWDFQIESDALLIMVQRRLGLPLSVLSGID